LTQVVILKITGVLCKTATIRRLTANESDDDPVGTGIWKYLIPRKAKFMDAISVFVYGHLALVDLSMAL
jgi:hypothetical protein